MVPSNLTIPSLNLDPGPVRRGMTSGGTAPLEAARTVPGAEPRAAGVPTSVLCANARFARLLRAPPAALVVPSVILEVEGHVSLHHAAMLASPRAAERQPWLNLFIST